METMTVNENDSNDNDNEYDDNDYFLNDDIDATVLEVINTFIIEQLQKEQLKQQQQQQQKQQTTITTNNETGNGEEEEEYIEDFIQEYNNIRNNIIETMNTNDSNDTNDNRIEITKKELQNDVMNSCRYNNDYIIICTIVSLYPKLIYYSDNVSGNTSFHMACANGHTTIVLLLLSIERILHLSSNTDSETKTESVITSTTKKSRNTNNKSSLCTICNKNGNTPLHYAVSNKQLDIVRILIQQSNINVLQQNNFGRSILTEGFTISSSSTLSTTAAGTSSNLNNSDDNIVVEDESTDNNREQTEDNNYEQKEEQPEDEQGPEENKTKPKQRDICTDILELLLQHDSASEEKLIATSNQGKRNQSNNNEKNDKNTSIGKDDKNNQKTTTSERQQQQQQQQQINNDVSSVIHSFTFGRRSFHHDDEDVEDNTNQQNTTTTTKTKTNITKTISINVRELAIATNDNDSILGQCDPNNDTTGYGIWSSSIICSQWMIDIFMNQYNTIFNTTTTTNTNSTTTGRTTATSEDNNLIVLELGSGCGLPGLCVASTNIPSVVYVTDFNIQTVSNLQYNINMLLDDQQQTQKQQQDDTTTTKLTKVVASTMNWSDQSTWPTAIPKQQLQIEGQPSSSVSVSYEQADVIIGSDLIYQSDMVPLLLQTISLLLKSGGHFFYVAPAPVLVVSDDNDNNNNNNDDISAVTVPTGSRQGHDEFIKTLLSSMIQQNEEGDVQVNNNNTTTTSTTTSTATNNRSASTNTNNPSLSLPLFTLVSKQLAPKEYYNNPLTNNDNDLAFIHFSELYTTQYNLYHFQKN